MKELHIEKFDALLSLAAAECVKDEATAFVSADLSGVEDNPRMLRKILGISSKSKWKALKIIVLVALLCMSIAFSACMLVPEIRNVIWNVFVKEREGSIEVGFETQWETEAVTESIVMGYPETIEKKMILTYVPEGYIIEEEISITLQYYIYYYSETQNAAFCIMQNSIADTNAFIDNEGIEIAQLEIKGNKAVLIENDTDEIIYTLIWKDDQYRYMIQGEFSSISELVKIAEGIILED